MAYYTEAEIEELVKEIEGSPEEWLEATAETVSTFLAQDSMNYLYYGIYWWSLKQFLNEKYPDREEWYSKGTYDGLMLERTQFKDTFRNVLAAVYYQFNQKKRSDLHDWYDEDDNLHDYRLVDHDHPNPM